MSIGRRYEAGKIALFHEFFFKIGQIKNRQLAGHLQFKRRFPANCRFANWQTIIVFEIGVSVG
jgi:hypothetical protein